MVGGKAQIELTFLNCQANVVRGHATDQDIDARPLPAVSSDEARQKTGRHGGQRGDLDGAALTAAQVLREGQNAFQSDE